MLLRSPPAKKVFFALVTTTPAISSFSCSSRATAAAIDSLYSSFIVLALCVGSSRVSTTIPSLSLSYRTALCWAVSVICLVLGEVFVDGGFAGRHALRSL